MPDAIPLPSGAVDSNPPVITTGGLNCVGLPPPDSGEVVVVTGANGLVASHCVKLLLHLGYFVRATVRNPRDKTKNGFLRKLGDGSRLQLVAADLQDANVWREVIAEGITHVFHVASPLPVKKAMTEDEVIKPAVEGTLNVLRACSVTKSVQRVVLTSSLAAVESAVMLHQEGKILTSDDWGDEESETASPYQKSKIMAEKCAWAFVKNSENRVGFELVTINPGVVIGPILSESQGNNSSMEVVQRLMADKMCRTFGLPDIAFSYVDVRDVARAHILAMKHPKAPNKRFLIGTERSLSFLDMVDVIENMNNGDYMNKGFILPKHTGPKCMYKAGQYLVPSIAQFLERWGTHQRIDNSPLKKILGMGLLPIETSMRDSIESALLFKIISLPKQSKVCCGCCGCCG